MHFVTSRAEGARREAVAPMVLLLKNVLFTVVIPGTAAVYVPVLITWNRAPAWGVSGAIAIALLAVGGAAYLWCVWEFATFGHGTPAPIDAPKKLVIRGLYKYTRNPMYVSVLTMILGWAVLFHDKRLVPYAFFLGLGFQAFVVFYEEPHLRRLFGDQYDEYRARVHRWLPRRPKGPTV